MLRGRGFEVLNVHQVARAWPRALSEMTVADVMNALGGSADAILVLHYRDIADYTYDSIRNRRTDKGFANISYTFAAFEIPIQRRILSAKEDGARVLSVVPFDPVIAGRPDLRSKIRIERVGENQTVELALAEDEIIALAVKYIVKGVTFVDPVLGEVVWRGLAELLF
jgi:hypothetical protein